VCRSSRHGNALSVAVGEVHAATADDADDLTEWTAQTLARAKRRCDFAGHYGLHGCLLVMVQTPKAGGVAWCRRLQRHLDECAQPADWRCGPIRAFFGLSSFSADSATAQGLLHRAEINLEAAKAGGQEGIVADGIAGATCKQQSLLAAIGD